MLALLSAESLWDICTYAMLYYTGLMYLYSYAVAVARRSFYLIQGEVPHSRRCLLQKPALQVWGICCVQCGYLKYTTKTS
jgi:hypothetical protein